MADYNSLKVPDLKKLLSERSLPLSGNKADLIGRLQADDSKKAGSSGMSHVHSCIPHCLCLSQSLSLLSPCAMS